MRALTLYLYRPLKISVLTGVCLAGIALFILPPEPATVMQVLLVPVALVLGAFGALSLLALLITWISCSTTEM